MCVGLYNGLYIYIQDWGYTYIYIYIQDCLYRANGATQSFLTQTIIVAGNADLIPQDSGRAELLC